MPSPTHPPTDTGAIGAERSVLADLLARVEAASGPDRALDVDLSLATGHDPSMYGTASMNSGGKTVWSFGGGERLSKAVERHPDRRISAAIWFSVPAYTASLDAVLALCERAAPGCYWRLEELTPEMCAQGPGDEPYWATFGPAGAQGSATHKTPALVLVFAMLRALIAQAPSPATTPTGVLETSLIVEGDSAVARANVTPPSGASAKTEGP